MWQLTAEQTQALVALARQRHLARLAAVLGAAFPAVRERVGERFGELIALGTSKGEPQGLTHLLALARYLACWFVLGAEFEARAGNEWAREILAAPGRGEGAKVFQLCRGAGEALERQGVPRAAFDAALLQLDPVLRHEGRIASLAGRETLTLGSACDLDAIDLREPEGGARRQHYRFEEGQWRRLPQPGDAAPVTVTAEQGAASLPAALHLLASAGQPARLRVRTLANHACDATLHPLVVLTQPPSRDEWRGPVAAELTLALASPPVDDGAAASVIGAETPTATRLLGFDACGLRASGAPLVGAGGLSTQLLVRGAEQHLMVWQREAAPLIEWPEAAAQPPTLPPPRLVLQRDGEVLDGSRWSAGLEALDRQLLAGLGRLATAWEREGGVTNPRLAAEPRLLAGSAAVTWGWQAAAEGIAGAPFWRIAGRIDWLACRLDLRFSGQLALQGALARLELHCAGTNSLQLQWDTPPGGDAGEASAAAQLQFQQGFVLAVQPIAQREGAMLDASSSVQGVLVGSCGLRARPEGSGLQWFCTLELEPVSVLLQVQDPLLGQQQIEKPLLPAMKLVDWSLG